MGITKNPEWANICVLEITFVFIVKKQRDTYIVLNQGTVIYNLTIASLFPLLCMFRFSLLSIL